MPPDTKIRVRNLSVRFDKKEALKAVDLDVYEKSVLGLMGPSASGKSSFISVINGLINFEENGSFEGDVYIEGFGALSDKTDDVALRKKVGTVFATPIPLPRSIFENVAFGSRLKGVRKRSELHAIVEESLKKAFLWDEVKNRLTESALKLSGGQQQRLCLARTLALQPEIILLDEPCSGLDPISTAKIEEALSELEDGPHDHPRLEQHEADREGLRFRRLLLHGEARRVRPGRGRLHEPGEQADRGLRPGEIRMRDGVTASLQTALRTKGLNLHYGPFHALKNVDFQVYKNSITSLIGPSGCGKSTLLRCFNRMNDLVEGVRIEGEITIDDASIEEMDIIDLRRRVGMVFQRPNPFPFSVYENMTYGLAIHGIKKRRHEAVERCLAAVGLWDDLKDRMKQPALLLSDETKQRLCIARLLTIEPEIILLDEPCSALDPIATLHVEELMLNLKRDYTILIVTHNMQQAARVSDYAGFMLLGELLEFGRTADVFTSPRHEKTEEYITGRFG